MARRADNRWLRAWYQGGIWVYVLVPLTGLFKALSALRRFFLCRFGQRRLPVPVLVVGNISLGGTGKTPVIIALVQYLQSRGYKPGVISRGYGGQAPAYPLVVSQETPVTHSGDEPLLIVQATGCAVCVDPDRVAAGQCLINLGCDFILSDDGLQHYRLARDLEIAVVDGERQFGNGWCLPTGPLREPVGRLRRVDWILVNGRADKLNIPGAPEYFEMKLEPDHWRRFEDHNKVGLEHFAAGSQVHAVAGIGNPKRFYQTLRTLSLSPQEHDFPDHHQYAPEDFQFEESLPVVMTAKDAVKCREFAQPHWYWLEVNSRLPERFWQALDTRLARLKEKSESVQKEQ
ncbi:tetraacyldisaccharide 4'-kinase [Marinimicrobium sp. ABcell2]|uniref:tetraacyldisaccharide 4'-kinase n=1 Tax=Marinimicrobium sp. ABcell2 TaxID=3069751 RepID=UPI0027AE293E|nr:tetraacyldisaccharide 4'-kinase [Marinimicrobium sp. ABcell2]MDQ2075608.1 tetraacyldisaccharide 4'-kinase [Marinimicrobium sp. ABcell2]